MSELALAACVGEEPSGEGEAKGTSVDDIEVLITAVDAPRAADNDPVSTSVLPAVTVTVTV